LQELITSATTLGALLGGLVAGILSDWTGRKLVLGIADVIFIGGAIAQAVSHNVWSMVRSFQNTCTGNYHLEILLPYRLVEDFSSVSALA